MNQQLKADARLALAQAGTTALLVSLVYMLMIWGAGYAVGKDTQETTVWLTAVSFCSTILVGLVQYGYARYCLGTARGYVAGFEDLFAGFTDNVGNKVLAVTAITLLVTFGFIFFIIPGVILSLSYSMTYYIMEDNPDMSAFEAMRASRYLMQGRKLSLLGLYMSFIGWYIVMGLTFGIAGVWVMPYANISEAMFYEEITA